MMIFQSGGWLASAAFEVESVVGTTMTAITMPCLTFCESPNSRASAACTKNPTRHGESV
jgi:hypothetical protein